MVAHHGGQGLCVGVHGRVAAQGCGHGGHGPAASGEVAYEQPRGGKAVGAQAVNKGCKVARAVEPVHIGAGIDAIGVRRHADHPRPRLFVEGQAFLHAALHVGAGRHQQARKVELVAARGQQRHSCHEHNLLHHFFSIPRLTNR